MDDKEKSVIEKLADTVSNAVGSLAKSDVSPTAAPDTARLAGTANEQMYIPDAAATPMPAAQFSALDKKKRKAPAKLLPAKMPKKAAAKKKSKKASAKKARKSVVKKTVKKAGKKKKAKRD